MNGPAQIPASNPVPNEGQRRTIKSLFDRDKQIIQAAISNQLITIEAANRALEIYQNQIGNKKIRLVNILINPQNRLISKDRAFWFEQERDKQEGLIEDGQNTMNVPPPQKGLSAQGPQSSPPNNTPSQENSSSDERKKVSAAAKAIVSNQHRFFDPLADYRYENLGLLGEGAMGKVYKAKDKRLGRDVAIKELKIPDGLSAPTEDAMTRFIREAQVTAKLSHPSILEVHDSGENTKGILYMVMEMVGGRELKGLLESYHKGEIELDQKTEITVNFLLSSLLKVSQAMAYAHSQGVIHRDLKPENIMVGKYGEVKVMDWGIAKKIEEDDSRSDANNAAPADMTGRAWASMELENVEATLNGTILGTPKYMSPEQANGRNTTPAADVFALGAMLTEILTGTTPAYADNKVGIFMKLIQDEYNLPIEIDPKVSRELNSLATRALAKNPEARLQAIEFAEEIQRYLNGEFLESHNYGSIEKTIKHASRNPAKTTAFLATMVSALVFIFAVILNNQRIENLKKERELTKEKAAKSILKAEADKGLAEARAKAAKANEEIANKINKNRSSADKLLSNAEASLRKGNRKAMDAIIQRALKVFPDNKFPTAAYYIKVAELYSRSTNGDKELDMQMLDKAERMLEEAIKIDPPGYYPLFLLNQVETKRQGKSEFTWTRQLDRLQEIATKNGDENEFTLFAKAFKLHQEGKKEEAEELYTECLRYSPDFVFALSNLGVILSDRGEVAEGLKHLKYALELEPRNPLIHFNYAMIKKDLKDLDDALAHLGIVLSIKDSYPNARSQRSEIYYMKGEYQRALNEANEALKYNPENTSALLVRANVNLLSKKYTEAYSDFNRVTAINPKLANAYINRANILQIAGKNNEAVMELSRLINELPELAIGYLLRGDLNRKLKRYKEALKDLKKYLRLPTRDPKLVNAVENNIRFIESQQK